MDPPLKSEIRQSVIDALACYFIVSRNLSTTGPISVIFSLVCLVVLARLDVKRTQRCDQPLWRGGVQGRKCGITVLLYDETRHTRHCTRSGEPRIYPCYLLSSPGYLNLWMGNCCSKSDSHEGGHVLLHPIGADRRDGQTVGAAGSERPDPRQAAALAAEQRLKAVCPPLSAPFAIV